VPATAPLFLIDALPAGEHALLTGEEGRHAGRVLRVRPGEPVQLSDGRGTVLQCTVDEVRVDGVALRVLARATHAVARPRLVVVQALPKGDRAELAVATMTELGVDEIVPWQAARCVTQWTGERATRSLQRWRRTAREAAKQSRRAFVPEVRDLLSTPDLISRLAGCTGLVLHESAIEPLVACPLPDGADVVVVVGPEGGIDDTELAALTAAGAHPVRLGAPVLRTSTAGAAALAALSVRLGRWA
jgi:16S rRNA (uracil1498-N3)-methyltransferase